MAFRRGLAPLAIALVVALAYWPGLYGFWTRDDYMQLAFARLVGSPWPVFLHDHYFPAPGSIFRPLGFASFWLSQALFGTDYFRNAFGDLALHVGVSLALYRVIRAGEIERVPAALGTLLFAVHPAVLGTALWWSARFDLLALLFGLIAIRAALDYASRRGLASLFVALGGVLAALLSKETALAAAAAVACVWLRSERLRRARVRPVLALAAVVALFFAWRAAVLGTMTSALTGTTPIVESFARGFVRWWSNVLDYATFWPRSSVALAVVLAAYVFIELADVWLSRGSESKSRPPALVDVVIAGLCLFLLPAVLQAPVAALNALPLGADASAVEAAMQSRLYYVSFGGLAIVLAAGAGASRRAMIPRVALTGALALCVAAFAWVSHGLAGAYAATTAAPRSLAERVATAVDRGASASRCRIVVLGIDAPPEWSAYVSADSIAKALTTDVARVGRCFVEADYATYFNLMLGDANPADAMPYAPRSANARPIPWLRIGGMTAAYLDPPPSAEAAARDGVVFLANENGAFVDVTSDVAAGLRRVDLR